VTGRIVIGLFSFAARIVLGDDGPRLFQATGALMDEYPRAFR
jgi:hypothetical protein